ncbi:MAG: hypothetical protein K9M45_07200 [Kiritimatiellales bacterium]|nr:hypothetical protein [Kiritimatiellales bacterium]
MNSNASSKSNRRQFIKSTVAATSAATAGTMTTAAIAESAIKNTELSIGKSELLEININGKSFISGESMTLGNLENGSIKELAPKLGFEQVTRYSKHIPGRFSYYRETGASKEKVEVTWIIKIDPYTSGSEEKSAGQEDYNVGVDYRLLIPANLLEKCKYKAVVGSTMAKIKKMSGEINEELDCKKLSTLRWLSLSGENLALTIDLNPAGQHSMGRKSIKCEDKITFKKEGEFYCLSFAFRRVIWGDTREFKLVFHNKVLEYDKIHFNNISGFGGRFIKTSNRYQFGDRISKYHKKVAERSLF